MGMVADQVGDLKGCQIVALNLLSEFVEEVNEDHEPTTVALHM